MEDDISISPVRVEGLIVKRSRLTTILCFLISALLVDYKTIKRLEMSGGRWVAGVSALEIQINHI